MKQEDFAIRLPQFEGPFDLLLFFIERDELDVQDIPIARIANDFLEYIHQMNTLNIEIASEFIFVAATLMRIKAKMLLPRPEFDDNGDEIDLKRDLVQRLIEYKKFKSISEEFRILEEKRFMLEKRGNVRTDLQNMVPLSDPGEELSSFDLYKLMLIYEKLVTKYKQKNTTVKHTVIQYPYTIENQKKIIAELLQINKKMDFNQLLRNSDNKVHFVYNFLALLEMLQQELISLQLGLGYNNFWVESKNDFSNN